MRSLCSGIVLFASVGWLASSVHAQSGNYSAPSLLPLPGAAPLAVSSTTASYTDNSDAPGSPGSSFLTNELTKESTSSSESPGPPPIPGLCSGYSGWANCSGCGCNSCCGGGWFGAVGGLVMGRNRANPYWTTFETGVNTNQLMNTQNAGANWAGGGMITLGKWWCGCGCAGFGVAFTYWGLAPMTGFASITDPNNALSTPINLNTQTGSVLIGANPASFFFDSAHEQTILRNDYVNNFEANLLAGNLYSMGRFTLIGLAGFRYFRFGESLTYGSVAGGFNFGDNGGADEAYLQFRVVNNLYGFQVGAIGNYMITQRLGVFVIPKAGIYANQMNGVTRLFSGNGINGQADGVFFPIAAHKTDISFLGEIDTGFDWAFTQNLRAFIGYRVVGVANIALADNQFLPFLADTQGFAQMKQNGGLILHGAFAGVAYTF